MFLHAARIVFVKCYLMYKQCHTAFCSMAEKIVKELFEFLHLSYNKKSSTFVHCFVDLGIASAQNFNNKNNSGQISDEDL